MWFKSVIDRWGGHVVNGLKWIDRQMPKILHGAKWVGKHLREIPHPFAQKVGLGVETGANFVEGVYNSYHAAKDAYDVGRELISGRPPET
jgi:hypothetical protein